MGNLRSFLCAVSGLALSAPAWATWHGFTSNVPAAPRWTIEKNDAEGIDVRLELAGFDQSSVEIDGKTYTQVSIPGLESLREKGMPDLPKIARDLVLDTNATGAKVVVIQDLTSTFDVAPIAPSKGDILRTETPQNVPYEFSPQVYGAAKASYPGRPAAVGKVFRMRDVQGVNLRLHPMRYDAASGKLLVTRQLVVRVVPEGSRGFQLLRDGGAQDRAFLDLYRAHFANFGMMPSVRTHEIEDTGKLLILSHPSFVSALAPLVRWKTEKGIQTTLASLNDVGGQHFEQIKDFIAKAYREKGISSVILVGDAEFMPFHDGVSGNAAGNEADPLYTTVDGDDNYPDMFISRISVKTAEEASYAVEKILMYEKQPEVGGDWYSRGLGIASQEGEPMDKERADILKDLMLGWHFTEVGSVYEPNDNSADIAAAVNRGVGFINYIGHGSTTQWVTGGFTNRHVDALKNGTRFPVIVSVACVNGNFAYYGEDSFAERWMKAGSKSNPKGAAAIFASSTNQSWVPPTVGQKAIVENMVDEKFHTVGALFTHGSVAILEDGSSTADQTFETWHTFGDATMEVRTEAPKAMNAKIPTQITEGMHEIVIKDVEPGTVVGVASTQKLMGRAVAPRGARATTLRIPLSDCPMAGETFTVTITGANKIPQRAEVSVVTAL